MIVLEFLKKENLNQGPYYQQMLRECLVSQLKINSQKVRRFVIFESDFALNITSKLYMYLQIMPEEVQLIRNNYEQFPDDEAHIYQSGLNLKRQMGLNYSKNILDSFRAFSDYISVINRICEVSECSAVEYQQTQGDKKIVFLEQFCATFFSQVMVDYFQPKLLNERSVDNVVGLRTTYQILLQILKGITNESLALTMFYFMFGRRTRFNAVRQEELEEDEHGQSSLLGAQDDKDYDFDRLKEPNTKIDEQAKEQKVKLKLDLPVKKQESQEAADQEAGEDPNIGKAPSAQMKDMSLQFSKLNFQAKNKLSSHAIEFPFSQKGDRREEVAFIEQDRNDRIMQIFNELPLDDAEYSFIMNSSRSRMYNADGGLDSSRYLETNMTNFDIQLEDIDNQYNNKDQQQIAKNFWNYINLNNTRADDSFLEESFTKQMLHPSFDLKKCRTEKLPTAGLKILNAFLSFNIAEINEQLLLRNLEHAADQAMFSQSHSMSTERQNLSGHLQESKYYQILKAQSQKLKGKGNFRHIMKLLTDLRDKLADQSTNGDSHFFAQDDGSDAVMI